MDLFQNHLLVQLQLHDLLTAADSQRQRHGKDQARLGIESGRGVKGECGAAQHALEAAHQVMMTDQTKVAGLAKSNSDFVANHTVGSAAEAKAGGEVREGGIPGMSVDNGRSCATAPNLRNGNRVSARRCEHELRLPALLPVALAIKKGACPLFAGATSAASQACGIPQQNGVLEGLTVETPMRNQVSISNGHRSMPR